MPKKAAAKAPMPGADQGSQSEPSLEQLLGLELSPDPSVQGEPGQDQDWELRASPSFMYRGRNVTYIVKHMPRSPATRLTFQSAVVLKYFRVVLN